MSTVIDRLARTIPYAEACAYLPLIEEIRDLKRDRHALIVAHNYHVPVITAGVADYTGDSLAMARYAAEQAQDASTIVVCGVRFMAETTKLLCPDRTVLLPASDAGCSLAESVTVAGVIGLRQRFPGVPIVAYVNTTAAVKAEVDICCTSANAVQVVESLRSDRVIMLPDRYLASFVAERVKCEIIPWQGACEVHERFSARDIEEYRDGNVYILAHPECPEAVQAAADYVGSTSGMVDRLRTLRPARALMLTECSMADNVRMECPDIHFERPCNLCPHMKAVTLEKIRDSLLQDREQIVIDEDLGRRARRPIARMLAL